MGEGASQEEARGGQGRCGEGAGRSSGPREPSGRGFIAALVSGVEAARTLQEARRMMLRGADSDASALVSADEFRADSASRPAERGDESGRAVKCMPSQCVFRRRARPRARPADGAHPPARAFFSFFFHLRISTSAPGLSLEIWPHRVVRANSQVGPGKRPLGPECGYSDTKISRKISRLI